MQVRRDALLVSFLLASPPPKTLQGVELADSTLNVASLRATLSPTGMVRRTATKPGTDVMIRRLNTPSSWGTSQKQALAGPMFFY